MSNLIYKTDYYGFVYIWYDSFRKMFYIGSHYGSIDDGYIGSNKWLQSAYKKRPEKFKRRILKYLTEDNLKLLQEYEQHYLDMIQDTELSISTSVMSGINKYYNMKKSATGGNGLANKGKTREQGWNKGVSKDMLQLRKEGLFSLLCDKPKPKEKKPYTRKPTEKTTEKRKYTCRNRKKGRTKVKSIYTPKPLLQIVCICCNKIFQLTDTVTNKKRKCCSLSCAAKQSPSAENGKKSAQKQTKTKTGFKKIWNDDGSFSYKKPE